jgi:hypothetical protein
MRLILILIIAAIAFGVVQGIRHGCQFRLNKATLNCILHGAPVATPTAETPPATPAPAPAAPAQ